MTDTYKSENAKVLVAIEPSLGDTQTPDRRVGHVVDSLSLPDLSREQDRTYTVSGGRTAVDKFKGQTTFEDGSLTIKPVDSLPFELLLLSEIDSNTGEIVTPANDTEAISYTVQVIVNGVNEDFVRTYSGCVTGSGSISVSNDDELIVELDYDAVDVGLNETLGDDTQGIVDKEPWSFRDNSSDLSIFGATFSQLEDFSVDVGNNTEIKHYINSSDSGKPSEIVLGNVEVDATAEIAISDADIYTELLQGDLDFTTTVAFDNTVQVLTIELLECTIESAPVDIPEEGVIVEEVNIVANDIKITVN